MNHAGLRNRRISVFAAGVLCIVLAMPFPLHGLAMVPTLALVALDVLLITATQSLAFPRASSLDERQNEFRDAAYHRAFRMLGFFLVVLLVVGAMTTVAATQPFLNARLQTGITGRLLVVFLELLIMMPTLVIAWFLPGPIDEEDVGGADSLPGKRHMVMAAAVAVPAVLWLLTFSLLPAQTGIAERIPSGFLTADTGVTCDHYGESSQIGSNFGATVEMDVEVCWNGQAAYAIAAPSLPAPPPGFVHMAGMETFTWPDLSPCGGNPREDYARIANVRCTETVDAAGTMHYAVHAGVAPLPGSLGTRNVVLTLVVTRDGRVVQMQ